MEMIGQVLWSQLPSDRKNTGLEKTAKNPTYNLFYATKFQDYVEEGLLFQNISKSKNYPCWPWSPISSHNTKLGHATLCWFCDAGSHIIHVASFYTALFPWGSKHLQRIITPVIGYIAMPHLQCTKYLYSWICFTRPTMKASCLY